MTSKRETHDRSVNVATQAMLIAEDKNKSQIVSCLEASPNFLLTRNEAVNIVENQIKAIVENWNNVCESSKVHLVEPILAFKTSI